MNYVDIYKDIIVGGQKSWVLFEHGTCIVFTGPQHDLTAQAYELLSQYGPVQDGTTSADFDVIKLETRDGWIVTCHHPDIIVYVDPEDLGDGSDLEIGLLGRMAREMDTKNPKIVHIEKSPSIH